MNRAWPLDSGVGEEVALTPFTVNCTVPVTGLLPCVVTVAVNVTSPCP